jgi:hypothetical protein
MFALPQEAVPLFPRARTSSVRSVLAEKLLLSWLLPPTIIVFLDHYAAGSIGAFTYDSRLQDLRTMNAPMDVIERLSFRSPVVAQPAGPTRRVGRMPPPG